MKDLIEKTRKVNEYLDSEINQFAKDIEEDIFTVRDNFMYSFTDIPEEDELDNWKEEVYFGLKHAFYLPEYMTFKEIDKINQAYQEFLNADKWDKRFEKAVKNKLKIIYDSKWKEELETLEEKLKQLRG